ncbi:hypothetical protein NESM_000414200 [Novymonas esmeraldas]|uniref:Uncharacterized protein n=1 Tax=Novymonas esmeraldas TaxID=1808958 RepID=A0AAW0ENZ8_9TRYP
MPHVSASAGPNAAPVEGTSAPPREQRSTSCSSGVDASAMWEMVRRARCHLPPHPQQHSSSARAHGSGAVEAKQYRRAMARRHLGLTRRQHPRMTPFEAKVVMSAYAAAAATDDDAATSLEERRRSNEEAALVAAQHHLHQPTHSPLPSTPSTLPPLSTCPPPPPPLLLLGVHRCLCVRLPRGAAADAARQIR